MKALNSMPGFRINEYKIILVPHEELSQKIISLKTAFHEKFGMKDIKPSAPQLILANFKQVKAAEQRIVNRLHMISMAAHPFKIELKDFGSYPSHTIYLHANSIGVTELIKKIRHDAGRLMKLDADNTAHFMSNGHLTIARKLKPWQYEKAWLEYSHTHFSGKFIADHMILVRRAAGEFKYRPFERFDFQDLPVDTKQGVLF